ncbi:1-aminocyclopropane-1-carboxylate deaminase/D-cysteine desulfhydrase [Calothrix sp. UHCC 0171]|uniref:1-aminocyclopropane-1-carboxylate deaminase/D-cysteine desulfhydrase n=1 Tax=Calothrix sp. UHCC 0171 TaxID=3110245 RepID=UPI002B1EBD7B|nr:pyridoxal-phosphate dependent enzyme [Calothrix sp. UHCC 0171]MEA5573637.1 pyridoxal-phosphate dependent enzyme [Calothrix sp. UHCC 0171]
MTSFFAVPPLQEINSAIAHQNNVELYVLRLDLMHPFVNGNKWFKLKYNLEAAKAQNFNKLLTFGGAYSNHIYATAAVGNLFGLQTIGVIRGEKSLPLNPTLDFAVSQGMQLVYLDRQTYRQQQTAKLQEVLKNRFGDFFIIPEGGCNLHGVRGCTEIISNSAPLIKGDFDVICLACGTGTTLAGVTLSLHQKQHLIGFPVLKGGEFLKSAIETLLAEYLSSDLPMPGDKSISWELICDYHFGGYAKVTEELVTFQKEFGKLYQIPLDYIYTAKMFYGVMDLIQQKYFSNCRILLIHTGGLQGNLGIENRLID